MTPEEITAIFADAATHFTPINGNPTDDDLTALRELLTPLLLAIPYDMDGDHNLIGLIEPTTAYIATWGEAFPPPMRPPAYDPNIAADATPVIKARMEAAHAVRLRDYASFEAAERAVTKLIRDAVDEIWYKDLKHPRAFYTSVTAAQLLEHLDANCGGLHPVDLINLPTDMMTYYATAEGVPEYINMLEDAQRKLERGKIPMLDVQLLAIASTAVLAAQHFPRTTDEWEALTPALKTWDNWKIKYRAAHIARKRQLLATGTAEPMGRANAVLPDTYPLDTFDKLDGYLDNLANAATHEKSTLAQLVDTNATLAANNATLATSLAALAAAYSLLATGASPAAAPNNGKRNNAHHGTRGTGGQKFAPNGYCWMHGYKVGLHHNSGSCKAKGSGHKDTATRANPMNGSSDNKGWDT